MDACWDYYMIFLPVFLRQKPTTMTHSFKPPTLFHNWTLFLSMLLICWVFIPTARAEASSAYSSPPVATTVKLHSSQCGQTNVTMLHTLKASDGQYAEYRVNIYDPVSNVNLGPLDYVLSSGRPTYLDFANSTNDLSFGVNYSITFQVRNSSADAWSGEGPACTVQFVNNVILAGTRCNDLQANIYSTLKPSVVSFSEYRVNIYDGSSLLGQQDFVYANGTPRYLDFAQNIADLNFSSTYKVRFQTKNTAASSWSPEGPDCQVKFESKTALYTNRCGDLQENIMTTMFPSYKEFYKHRVNIYSGTNLIGSYDYEFSAGVPRYIDFAKTVADIEFGTAYQVKFQTQNTVTSSWSPEGPACDVKFESKIKLYTNRCGDLQENLMTTMYPDATNFHSYRINIYDGATFVGNYDYVFSNGVPRYLDFAQNVADLSFNTSYQVKIQSKNTANSVWSPEGESCDVKFEPYTKLAVNRCGNLSASIISRIYPDITLYAEHRANIFQNGNLIGSYDFLIANGAPPRYSEFIQSSGELEYGVLYQVRFQTKNTSNSTWSPNGPVCEVQFQNQSGLAAHLCNNHNATINSGISTGVVDLYAYEAQIEDPTGAFSYTTPSYTSASYPKFSSVPGLQANTTYNVRIRVKNTASSNWSVWSDDCPITFPLVADLGPDPAPANNISLGDNLTVNGGGTPYSYSWSGPNGWSSTAANPTVNNASGTYIVTVTDAYGLTTTDALTVIGAGTPDYELFWEDITNVNYNIPENTLNYTNIANYGNAYSQNELGLGENGRIEFIVTDLNIHGAFGLFYNTGTYQHSSYFDNFSAIDFAYDILGNTATVYHAGVITGSSGPIAIGDVLKIERVGTTINFYHNNNIINTTTSTTASLKAQVLFQDVAQQIKPLASTFKAPLNVEFSEQAYDHTQKGEIDFEFTGGKRPYKVELTDGPIISQAEYEEHILAFYNGLNRPEQADLASEFDLTSFPSYQEFLATKMEWSWGDLPSGSYNLAITDADGSVVYMTADVAHTAMWDNTASTDWDLSNVNQPEKTRNQTFASMAPLQSMNFWQPQQANAVDFSFPQIVGDVAVGLMASNQTNVSSFDPTDFYFGFKTDQANGNIYLYSGQSATHYSVVSHSLLSTDELVLEQKNNVLTLYLNGSILTSRPDAFPKAVKRMNVFAETSGDQIRLGTMRGPSYIPLYQMEENAGNCGLKSTEIKPSSLGIGNEDLPGTHVYSYTWTDHLGNVWNTNSPILQNVSPGWYTLSGTVTGPNGFSWAGGTYYIGNKINWIQEQNAINHPTTNTLKVDYGTVGFPFPASALAESNSSNTYFADEQDQYGWIYTELPQYARWPYNFDLQINNEGGIGPVIIGGGGGTTGDGPATTGNGSVTVVDGSAVASVNHYGFKGLYGNGTAPAVQYGIKIVQTYFPLQNVSNNHDYLIKLSPQPSGYTGPTSFGADVGDQIVQVVDDKTYKLYINTVLVASHTYGSTFDQLQAKGELTTYYAGTQAFQGQVNDRLLNCLASFGCKEQSYNELTEELNGGHFYTINGQLYVNYKGEYNRGLLNVTITDELGADVTNNVVLSSENKQYGDNRYVFDFNNLNDGYYLVEIQNEKSETYRLKVFKEL